MRKSGVFALLGRIFGIIACFIYILVTAMFYSLGDSLYWLFLALFLLTLIDTLGIVSYKNRLLEGAIEKKARIAYFIFSGFSLLAFPAVIFNFLAYFLKGNSMDAGEEGETDIHPDRNESTEEATQEKAATAKRWYRKPSFFVMASCLTMMFASSIAGSAIESNGYQVYVTDKTLTYDLAKEYNEGEENAINGKNFVISQADVRYSYTEYRPKNASSSHPLPTIFVQPGFTRTKATMSQYAIEYARRGAVVYVMDPGSQGSSTYSGYIEEDDGTFTQNSYAVAGSGLEYLIQYIYNNVGDFPYVDRKRIGAIGHSAGGNNVVSAAADFAGSSYDESVIKSLYISGYIKSGAVSKFIKLRCNAALSYAYYDEGEYRYETSNNSYLYAAGTFINSVNGVQSGSLAFEEDTEYGDFADGSFRVIHRENTNHCFQMYDPLSIENTINFFRRSLSLDTAMADGDQIWFLRECLSGLGLVSIFGLILSLFYFLVDIVPFLRSLGKEAKKRGTKEEAVRLAYRPKRKGGEGKEKTFVQNLLMWLPMVLTAIIACLDYIPLARLSFELFPEATADNAFTFFFPARMINAVYLWALINGSIGLLLFFGVTLGENVVYALRGQKERISWEKFRLLKAKPGDLLKSLALALSFFTLFYGLIALSSSTLHQDYRFMLISASPLNARMFVTWLIYLPGFYVFYLSNSIRVNLSLAHEGESEKKTMIIASLANSLGLVFILVINYWVYFRTGYVKYGYWSATDSTEMWLYVNMVFGLIPMMALLPAFNRLTYKRCGNVYAGALLACMIFTMMSISASVSFIPM